MFGKGYPRGIRNNNPGNIRHSDDAWLGKADIQGDKAFVTFSQPVYGLRALMKILITYMKKHGCNTIYEIIHRYAPASENDVNSYVEAVAVSLNKDRYEILDLDMQTLITLSEAIVIHENGHPRENMPPYWYGSQLYRDAAIMAMEGIDAG